MKFSEYIDADNTLVESETNDKSIEDLEKDLDVLLKQLRKVSTNLRNAKKPEKKGKWSAELNQLGFSIDMTRDQIEKLKKQL